MKYSYKVTATMGHAFQLMSPCCGTAYCGYHLARGCPALTEAYIERHHAAGMYILKAVKAGHLGSTVVPLSAWQADASSNEKRTNEGLPDLPANIPSNILTPNMFSKYAKVDTDKPDSRPDITLYWKDTSQGRLY
jgi:hypothetical protein